MASRLHDAMAHRHIIQRAPLVLELTRRITAAQQRRRQLFERGKGLSRNDLGTGNKSIPSWRVILLGAGWLPPAAVSIWHVERGAPRFVPEPGPSIGALPRIVGFEDD
jgi:hypothetical protein